MPFTKLTKPSKYTDILAVGVGSTSVPTLKTSSMFLENMESFVIQHLKYQNGRLKPVDDMIHFEGAELFHAILRYFPSGRNTLVVSNSTLVAMGASDFCDILDRGDIVIADSLVSPDDYGIQQPEKVDSQIFIASCPPTIIGLRNIYTGGRITVVDIANYGIKYICDIYESLPDDEKALIPNYAETGVSVDNAETCCALIARFMQEYDKVVSHYKLGGIALTYAGQGMKGFRYKFYHDNILTHRNDKARILEGHCYTGGRAEYRFKGHYHGKVYLLDLRSYYPSLGTQKEFPVELLDYQEHPIEHLINSWMEKGIIFAWCHLDTPEPAFPLRRSNNTFFPVGRFNTFLCGEEFKEAWKNGYITTIYRAALYRTERILADYSRFLLDARTESKVNGNRLAERIIKSITNGTWGQFGKINNTWLYDANIVPDRPYGGFIRYDENDNKESQYRIINWEVSRLTHGIWTDNTFPAIAAVMNSYSRHQLYRHALLAGLSNVLYFSIDGMIVTQDGYDRLQWLISPDEVQYGTYKVSESSTGCYIQDYGVYRIGNKVAFQGVPNKPLRTYKGFWSVVSDKLPASSLQTTGKTPLAYIERPLPDRQSLGVDDNSPGKFMPLSMLDELPLLQVSDDHPQIQPHFRFGEWQQ